MASDGTDVYLKFIGEWGNKPLKGECTDENHPGKDGWIEITQFSFGFGSGDKADISAKPAPTVRPTGAQTAEEIARERNALLEERNRMLRTQQSQNQSQTKGTPQSHQSWGTSGPMTFDMFSFTKSTDRLSPILTEICHSGKYKFPKVEIEAVRRGGTEMQNKRIPFLRLIFENVHLKSCRLRLVSEALPTEDVEFEYDKITMQTLWTDNATGDRLPQQPISAGWNLQTKAEELAKWEE